jgi:hypothetical protein
MAEGARSSASFMQKPISICIGKAAAVNLRVEAAVSDRVSSVGAGARCAVLVAGAYITALIAPRGSGPYGIAQGRNRLTQREAG